MTTTDSVSDAELGHHFADLDGTTLHYVAAGRSGSPILLVHGFPESWWAFHKVIPLLAARHRVFAVDLRGFGDSAVADDSYTSAIAAADLHRFIEHLGVGPVHLAGQDIAGAALLRLAAIHPQSLRSFIGVEMGLAGFGLEAFADVTHGGSWHIGALAAPGIAEMLFAGRERRLLREWAFPSLSAVPDSITDDDVERFARAFARDGGWRGAVGIYRSILAEGDELRELAAATPIEVPVLAIGGFGGLFTAATLQQVTTGEIESVVLEGVGHYIAMEAPEAYASAVSTFMERVDERAG